MTVVAAATTALAVLALLLLSAAAVRRPLLARIAYRQVVRRPGQSAVMVCGMAFASGAILAMAGLADVYQSSSQDQLLVGWGRVDLAVTGGGASFSPEVASRLAADPRTSAQRAAVTGGLDLVGAVADIDQGRAVASLQLVGVDGPTMAPFGAFELTDGRRLGAADLGAGHAVVSALANGRLHARPGDHVRVTLGTATGERAQLEVTLAGIAEPRQAGAYGLLPSLFLPLADLQRAAGTDLINIVRITVRGDGPAAVDAADRAAPALRQALAGIPQAGGLELREVKRDDLRYNDDALAGPGFKTTMLVISLLVVLAGVAVVVNILLAMSEERRPRLAVLRALGLSRGELVWTALIEAAFYGLAGAALGVLPGLAYVAYEALVKPPPPPDFWAVFDLPPTLTIDPSSFVFAVAAGLLISLVTVLAASVRTSRMTISSAVKDLPDPATAGRASWTRWLWVAGLGVAGAAGLATPVADLRDLGGALVLVAAMTAARGRVPERVRASLAGAALAAWGLGFLALAPNEFDLVLGAMVIAVALGVWGLALLFSANLSVLEGLATAGSSRLGAALRPPLAYLTRRPVRTGLATGTFGLVLAGLTVFNIFLNSEVPTYAAAGSGWDVMVRSAGGPALTLPASVQGRVAATSAIRTLSYVGEARDGLGEWHQAFNVFLALSDDQLEHPPIQLISRKSRYPDDAAVWRAMRDDPSLAITFGPNVGNGPIAVGSRQAPVTFSLAGGATMSVLGTSANWFVVSERALSRLPAQGLGNILLVRAAPGSDPGALAADIRSQMHAQGVDAITTREALDADVAGTTWWVNTFFGDIFDVALVVGVLGLGVLTLRAVVERRRSIAVLRALGYQQPGVLAALLVEALLLTSIGVIAGMAVGLSVGYVWVTNPGMVSNTPQFGVDVPRLVAPVALVYGAVLLATLVPAIRASRLPVAEALRIVD